MKIIITETEEVRELTLVDPKSGCEWTQDFINNGDLNVNDDDEYTMSQDDFDWWEPVVEAYQKADNAVRDLATELEDPAGFLVAVAYAMDVDLEDQPAAMISVVESCTKKETDIKTLGERLNFSSTKGNESAVEIKKWHNVNHGDTLALYLADNNISWGDVDEHDFDGCVILMQDYGQSDKSTDTYFFWVDAD